MRFWGVTPEFGLQITKKLTCSLKYQGHVCTVEGISFVNNVKMEFYKLILFVIKVY